MAVAQGTALLRFSPPQISDDDILDEIVERMRGVLTGAYEVLHG